MIKFVLEDIIDRKCWEFDEMSRGGDQKSRKRMNSSGPCITLTNNSNTRGDSQESTANASQSEFPPHCLIAMGTLELG